MRARQGIHFCSWILKSEEAQYIKGPVFLLPKWLLDPF